MQTDTTDAPLQTGTAPPLTLDELFGADDFEDNYDVPELPPPLDLEAIGGARSPPRQHERTQPAASRDISNGSPTAVNRPSEGEATPTAALGEGGDASGSEPKKAKAPRKIRTYEKYDENMLASSKGLHRLLGMAKKLKLRKPHKENTRHNLTKILEVYQIWGHTLYPSARFEEFVTMTEKLCHKNRMKIAHKALLEEERRRVRGEYRDGPTPPPEDAFQETKVAAAPGASGNDGRIDSATSRGRLPDNAKDDANDDEALRRSALARLAALREEEMAESIAAAVAATADGVPAAAEPPAVAARAGSDEFGRLREAPLPQRDIAPVMSTRNRMFQIETKRTSRLLSHTLQPTMSRRQDRKCGWTMTNPLLKSWRHLLLRWTKISGTAGDNFVQAGYIREESSNKLSPDQKAESVGKKKIRISYSVAMKMRKMLSRNRVAVEWGGASTA